MVTPGRLACSNQPVAEILVAAELRGGQAEVEPGRVAGAGVVALRASRLV